MTTYAELRLRIDRGVGRGSYRIVATGPAGEALGRFKLPVSDMELENFILKVGATRRGRRRIDSPEMELAKNFGTKLFGALFEGDVRELYRSSLAETRNAGQGMRVTLSLTGAPELLQVPWEYMYDHPSFLSISTWTPIVRYLDLPKPRRPLQVALPIRILALVSSPSDAEEIDAKQERAKLEAALAPLVEAGAIAIDWLPEASLRALQRQLRRGDYHVFHFIGHGGYDQEADDGVLLFEDEVGRGRRISGIQLGTILADEVSLRLAVLNSCEGARSSLQDPFSGVATSLIEREIPAVIGMQFEITDRAAIVFASEFYSALADGLPVDSSVAEARKAIYADQNDIEWGTPVLFMRVADGRLFDVQSHPPIRGPEVASAAAEVGEREAGPDAQRAAQQRRDREAIEAAERERAAADAAERERAGAEAIALAQRDEAERAEAERAEADRIEATRVEAERVEVERAEASRLEADRIEAARVEAERRDAERAEGERLALAEAEAAEREREAAAALAAAKQLEGERREEERLAREAADAAERQRAEAEAQRLEIKRVEQERLSREAAGAAERKRAEAERLEAARLERERFVREVAERQRTEAEAARLEATRVEQERASDEAAKAAEQKRTETERLEAARLERERFVREAAERQRTEAEAERLEAARVPFSLVHAAARAALGSLVGLVMIWVFAVITRYDTLNGVGPDFLFDVFAKEVGFTAFTVTIAVSFAEGGWQSLRIPTGSVYRRVGGNRWVASAIEGSVMGATVGWLTTVVVYWNIEGADRELNEGSFVLHTVFMGLGFLFAEAMLEAIRRRPSPA